MRHDDRMQLWCVAWLGGSLGLLGCGLLAAAVVWFAAAPVLFLACEDGPEMDDDGRP